LKEFAATQQDVSQLSISVSVGLPGPSMVTMWISAYVFASFDVAETISEG
jgi:hypothetical protein